MDEPVIAGRRPAIQNLAPGKYAWCACGRSAAQPLCDGSHRGTEFRPVIFEVTESKPAAYCQCKRTGNKPFCDGSHNGI